MDKVKQVSAGESYDKRVQVVGPGESYDKEVQFVGQGDSYDYKVQIVGAGEGDVDANPRAGPPTRGEGWRRVRRDGGGQGERI